MSLLRKRTRRICLLGSPAAGQAVATAVLLCVRDSAVPAAIHQQIFPVTNAAMFVRDEVLPLIVVLHWLLD